MKNLPSPDVVAPHRVRVEQVPGSLPGPGGEYHRGVQVGPFSELIKYFRGYYFCGKYLWNFKQYWKIFHVKIFYLDKMKIFFARRAKNVLPWDSMCPSGMGNDCSRWDMWTLFQHQKYDEPLKWDISNSTFYKYFSVAAVPMELLVYFIILGLAPIFLMVLRELNDCRS